MIPHSFAVVLLVSAIAIAIAGASVLAVALLCGAAGAIEGYSLLTVLAESNAALRRDVTREPPLP